MAEAGPHDCEKQKNEISELLKTPLKKGETWYLVDTKWFKQWKKYVGYDNWDTSYVGDQSAYPGPIDNSPLFKPDSKDSLKEHLIDELDYMLVPELAWEKLVGWYGVVEDQVQVARKVIEQGMFVKHCKVEVYLMDLKLCTNSDTENTQVQLFSRADTIDVIEKEMRRLFTIDGDKEVRLWNKYMSNTYEHLAKLDNTIQDAGLFPGQVIVIEQKNEDGSWPRQTKTTGSTMSYNTPSNSASSSGVCSGNSASNSLDISSYSTSPAKSSTLGGNYNSSSSYYSGYGSDGYKSSAAVPGLCGLSNLGNTCFMNSAIQCMSHVPLLTQYLIRDLWRDELNHDNPLGMKGEIASSYADLIKNMWSGRYSYTVPRNFKMAVGRFAPQFSGYQQQDSQELMAFLLDGLHEDLNRIKKKPYVEQKDAEGRADQEVAQEAWDNYKKRNDSIIVDIFHGLLKSTLVCPECAKISVTFDPFCYLSLPLPYKRERNLEVFLIRQEPSKKPRQYKVIVPRMGVVSDLCKSLSKVTNIPSDKMLVTDVYNHRLHKIFSMDEALNHILDRDDIFVYEVPVSTNDDPETLIVPVYMREVKLKQQCTSYSQPSAQLFGQPLLVAVPRKTCSYEVLYNCLLNRMARYVTAPGEKDEWWRSPGDAGGSANGEVEMDDEGYSETSDSSSAASKRSLVENGREEGVDEPDQADQPAGADAEAEVEVEDEAEGEAADPRPDTEEGAGGEDGDNGDEAAAYEDMEKSFRDKNGRPRLFKFAMVNSYGSAEMEKIKDDGQPIRFSSRSYLAVDWHPKARELCYNDKAAEDYERDESVNTRLLTKKTIQLTECLDLFTTRERLGEQDPWYCPRCKKHQQATKKFDLWQLPRILVIHLKRFSYNRYWRDKLDAFVEFPTRGLEMRKWVLNSDHGPAMYDLIAVANHYGGMGGGHYTAYAKKKEEGGWYHFDDSNVSQCSEDAVVTKAGYVLVYELRGAAATTTNGGGAACSQGGEIFNSNGDNNESCDDDMDVN